MLPIYPTQHCQQGVLMLLVVCLLSCTDMHHIAVDVSERINVTIIKFY